MSQTSRTMMEERLDFNVMMDYSLIWYRHSYINQLIIRYSGLCRWKFNFYLMVKEKSEAND